MKKTSKLMLSLLLALVFVFQMAVPMASAAAPDGGFSPDSETFGYRVSLAAQDDADNADEESPETLLTVKVGEETLEPDSPVSLSNLLSNNTAISVSDGYYVSALYLHSENYANDKPVNLLTHATSSANSANITLTRDAMTVEDTETNGVYYLNGDLISGARGNLYTLEIVLDQIDADAPIEVSYSNSTETLENTAHTVYSADAVDVPRYQRFAGWMLTYGNGSSVLVQPGESITPYASCNLSPEFENIVYTATVSAMDAEMTVGEESPELTAEVSGKTLDSMNIAYDLVVQKDGSTFDPASLEAGEYSIAVVITSVTDTETKADIPSANYAITSKAGILKVNAPVNPSPEPTPEPSPEPTTEPSPEPTVEPTEPPVPEKIAITVEAKAPKFDAQSNSYVADGYTASVEPAEGDELKVDLKVEIKDGMCTVTPEVKVLRGKEDVTEAAYDISIKTAELTLPTVTITANTPKYDTAEKKFVADGYTSNPAALQDGDKIDSVGYAIGTDNKCMPSNAVIKNADGQVVTNKYIITYVPSAAGEVPATPARGTLTIKAKDSSWTYDGKAHELKEYEQPTGLADGDTIKSVTFSDDSTITNAGTKENKITAVVIEDADGNEVTSQYSIVYQPGTLTVNKRSITLTVGNVNITNGSTFTITKDTVKVTLSGDGLAENQKLAVTCKIYQGNTALDSAKDEGTYTLKITGHNITDANGTNVNGNYTVNYKDGTLTIKKEAKNLPLTITAKDGTWTYDGKAHTCTEYDVSGLVDGDTIASVTFTATSTITDAGTQKNEITSVVIKDSSGKQVESGKYKINLVAGTLTVKKFPLTIKAESASKTYDGKPLENKNVTAGKLASTDHKLSVSYTVYNSKGNKVNSPIEVGTYTKKITDYKIMSGNTDVTKNYEVKLEDGTLTIKSSDKNNSTSPKTGDESNLGLWIGLLAFSAVVVLAVVVFIVIKNKKKNSENIEELDDNDGSDNQ